MCSCSKQAQVSAITHLQGINIKHQQGINEYFYTWKNSIYIMWGENLLCHVCCGPQHEKQSGVREMALVQKRHVTTWQVKPCPFVLQTSLTQVVFSWSNTLDVFPPTILPFLPPMFSCCVPCYHDYVLWDKWSPHLCYFYMSFNNCFSRWASLYWWLSYISSIYTYMIFFSMNIFVPAIFSSIHVFYYHDAFIKWPLTTVTLCVFL